MTLSLKEFSELMNISDRQIQRYVKDGMPTILKGKRNHYGSESIQWLYDNGIKQISRSDDNEDVEFLPARERKDLADAKNKEFDLAVKMKKYIPQDIAKANGSNAGLFVRDTLSSMPDRFIPRLRFSEEDKHYLRNELKEEIYETLVKISEFAKG